MVDVRLHDASIIEARVSGDGPAVLLPVNPVAVTGERGEELRRWGADPQLGRKLVDGLRDRYRVVAFDYEGHLLAAPQPDTLTPDTIAADLLAVADAAGVQRFAYYGYSWLAVAGLQLAARTDRLTGLAIGGYPPLDGPYAQMLTVTRATHALAVAAVGAPAPTVEPAAPDEIDWSSIVMTLSPAQTRQWVTLYEALQGFDEQAALARISGARLCFVGAKDEITYDERWGGVSVSMAAPTVEHRAELERLGWDVRVLDGLDHMGAMQAAVVVPMLREWLGS